jgi:hypothetical protein
LTVQAHERNRESRPKLFLELGHHALGSDDEDALALATADEFSEKYADLDGLAEANRIGQQDAVADLAERLQGGVELIGKDVDGGAVANPEVGIRGRRLPEEAFQVKAGFGKSG